MTNKNLSDLVIRQSEFKGEIGAARADITPPDGIYSRSWGSAKHDAAEGIHRPLFVTSMFLRGGDPSIELYLVCFDLGWWYDIAHEMQIRERILKDAGIRDEQLITHMGHTHSGPITNLQNLERQGGHLIVPYRDKIVEGAVKAIRESRANAQAAVASWADGRCNLARNRDLVLDSETFLCSVNPDGPSDDTVLVGRVTDATGKIIATMVNYACHPVSLGGGNKMISPDYYGAMREVVERDTGGAPCLFFHGASGDMTPLRSYEADTAIADQNGRQLGYAALSTLTGMLPPEQELAFDRIEDSGARLGRWSLRPKPASTALKITRSTTELPYVNLPTEAELLEQLKDCTDRPLKERLERRLMVRRDVGEGKSRTVSTTLVQMGDAFLVGAPAEPYSAYQKEIRARFPGHAVMVLNIVNGNVGYLAPAETYDKPGLYQIKISLFQPGCMEQVIEDTAKSLKQLEAAPWINPISVNVSSETVLQHNRRYIPGGISSVNRSIDPAITFVKGEGAYLWDSDGKRYIDYHAGFAPYFLGHNFAPINQAAAAALGDGDSLFGAGPSIAEGRLAQLICENVPAVEKITLLNTGSEATSLAIRIARAVTGRSHIIVMQGGYNGNHDELACNVFNTLADIGPRVSPGEYPLKPLGAGTTITQTHFTHAVNYNDLESVRYVCRRYPVAALITEPLLQNIGVVKPQSGFLEGLRDLADEFGFLLVFDEVKTGFRHAVGGYAEISGVRPDLVVYGKAVANGFPLAVVGGKPEYMDSIIDPDPARRPFVAGTYNGHPVAVAAAIETVRYLVANRDTLYPRMERLGAQIETGIMEIFARAGITACVARQGSAFSYYLMEKPPADLHDIIQRHDFGRDVALRRALIQRGVFFVPIATKQCSLSAAHTEADVAFTLEQFESAVAAVW